MQYIFLAPWLYTVHEFQIYTDVKSCVYLNSLVNVVFSIQRRYKNKHNTIF